MYCVIMATQSYLHIFQSQISAEQAVAVLLDRFQWKEKPDIFIAGAITIKEIRAYLSNTSKRPLTSEGLILIIHDAHRLSGEIANTMLKVIEEPPPYLSIHFTTVNESKMLSTIVSRCHRIRHDSISEESNEVEDFSAMDMADKLRWARDMAIDEQCNTKLRRRLEYLSLQGRWIEAQAIEKLYRTLAESNANRRLALEHFAINS